MATEAQELLEAGGRAIAARYMPLIRRELRDGKRPPNGWTDGRDVSVIRQLLRKGHDPLEIEDAICGLAVLQRDGRWPTTGPLTMAMLNGTTLGAVRTIELAAHEGRKRAESVVRTA